MTARILPPAEWDKLDGTEAESVWRACDPAKTTVVVVERDGQIVGCHLLLWVLHAECLWIAPEHRGKGTVARRLWWAVQQTAKALGARALVTAALDARVKQLLAHVGAEQLPGEHFVLAVRG